MVQEALTRRAISAAAAAPGAAGELQARAALARFVRSVVHKVKTTGF